MTEAPKLRAPVFGKVEGLRPDTSGHNLVVKVIDAKLVVDKPARGALKPQRVAECTVGDETGCILLTARNEQVDLAKPGSYLTLRNAKIDMFRGSMRLAVNQWGKVEPASGHSFQPKADFNLSLVEYELVPVPQEVAAPAAAPAVEDAPAAEAAANGDGKEAAADSGEAGFEAAEAPVPAAAS
ncbi:hypothetical protein ABPG77_005826 [Micractinium sp. CCAP 211/92]